MSVFDDHVEALASRLRAIGKKRLTAHELRNHSAAIDPLIAHAPDSDARLLRLVDALVSRGVLRLPRRRASPSDVLPPTVFLTDSAQGRRMRVSPCSRPWCSELRWFLSVRATRDEFRAMEQLNDFIVAGGAQRPIAPLRERSLQIFKDEKALDRLSRSRLQQHCDLIELARAYRPHPPLHCERITDGPWALVAENYDTYETLRLLCRPDGKIGLVAYGAGSHFTGAVLSFLDVADFLPQRILYFGDLDPRGLRMPIFASDLAVRHGLPVVEPATALYRLLFEVGKPQPLSSEAHVRDDWLRWLPGDLRSKAAELLCNRHRLAQEWVSREVLSSRPDALRHIAP